MIQIQRHIEILLLSHDCVIVPGFGGFIAHHVDARYDKDDRLWLPPYRTLGFNPQLTLNDSLLVQSYVEAYDLSYPDALRQIESEVEELKGILHTEGEYELDSVGTLSVNIDGNYEFEPCEAGILSPDVYGLADFSFRRLKDVEPLAETTPLYVSEEKNESPSPALLDFTDGEEEYESRAVVIKISWVRNAIAIAAAIACFFLLATPVANSDLGTKTMSQLQGNILYKLMPKDSNMTPAQPVEMKEVASNKDVKEVKEVKVADNVNSIEKKDSYCIVLASQVKRNNAEDFIEQVKKRGITDARINIDNGTLRVICGGYDNQSDAYNHLNKIASDIEFADAWVYKIKGV
ncbi:MAG: SPOR domain-containing protein [Prevotella sp.]|nr:SPOR domain-containing protein [Prevotella sp.]